MLAGALLWKSDWWTQVFVARNCWVQAAAVGEPLSAMAAGDLLWSARRVRNGGGLLEATCEGARADGSLFAMDGRDEGVRRGFSQELVSVGS